MISQFGLMFFEDRAAALKDMWRVLRPDGRLAVAVWDAVENVPGYAAMIDLLQRLFGDPVADALRAPFSLSNPSDLLLLLSDGEIDGVRIETQNGRARFPSIEAWVTRT